MNFSKQFRFFAVLVSIIKLYCKMKRIFIIGALLTGIIMFSFSQTGVAINKDGSAPDASSILDVSGTDGGILIPRMTAAQRTAILSPATGLLVYDLDSTRFYYYDGEWLTIANPNQLGGAASYAEFEGDGTLVFYGSSTTYEDLQVPALTTARNINPPNLVPFRGNVLVYEFSDENAGNEEQVYFSVQIPHSWDEGTTIYPHVHFACGTTSVDSVRWGLEYSWASVEENFPVSTNTIYASKQIGTAYDHKVVGFGGITPTTSQDKISSILICRLFRNSSNAIEDSYNGDDVYLLQFDIHYQVNTLGSRLQWIK